MFCVNSCAVLYFLNVLSCCYAVLARRLADDVLLAGVRSVTDLMVNPGLINLDFADVQVRENCFLLIMNNSIAVCCLLALLASLALLAGCIYIFFVSCFMLRVLVSVRGRFAHY